MKKKEMKKIIMLLGLCLLFCACGQMISDEPTAAMPKKGETKTAKIEAGKEKAPSSNTKTESAEAEQAEQEDIQLVLADVEGLLAKLSLEEKVGQMFLARCPETGAIEAIKKYHLGGYILFGRDFKDKTKEQVKAELLSYQSSAGIPMWIAVDEEGGTVNRISRNPALRITPFASPQSLYHNGGWERIKNDTAEKAELLLSLGVNLNMAPVCDIPEKETDFIYDRSFSTDPKLVEEYAGHMIREMNEAGIASMLKHFPGYGSNADTHTEPVIDQRTLASFKERDFLPFVAGIKNGAGAILVSHNVMAAVDDKFPASLSEAVHLLLRKDLAFQGVIMTDDLMMGAIGKQMTGEEAAVLAVLAGNDMLCATSFEVQIPAVIEAVKSGRIKPEQIDQAVRRILLWKQSFMLQE